MTEENNLEKWMEANYIEHLQAAARALKTWCKSHQDSSNRYCLTCCFWDDTEGCIIYNWPEYWEV